MKKLLSGILIACLALCFCAAVRAEGATLSLNRDSLTLSVGRYVTVYAFVSPAGALRDDVVFSVSDETVASVSGEGKVRALHVGECTLTAVSKYDETVSVTIPVRVIIPAERVEIIAGDNGVVRGNTLQLSAAVEPENATMQEITFSSSDESVASVTPDGLLTGLRRGQVIVTAESADGRASDRMRIAVRQPPESVTVSPEAVTVAEGKTKELKAAVLPADTDDKTVFWASADESVATVSDRGVVTGVQLGETVVTAACKDNPDATFSVPVTVLKLATGVAFARDSYDVLLGESIQLAHTVFPSDTSDQAVTYRVGNARIASVDENGLVTALRGGRTTVTVTTADGSRKSGTAEIRVQVPVTGVSYPYTDIRVGQGYYGHFTVRLEPSDATNTNMTWVTGDPDIATVTGDSTTFKIVGGENYGRTTVTGTTEDGGYTITLNVNVGSLYRAVTVRSLRIRNGRPYITLQNNSDMVISQVRYYMRGLDHTLLPVRMSLTGDPLTLYGTYDLPLYPGGQTEHGNFTFFAPSDYPDLTYLTLVVTGWSSNDGYYGSNGKLQYTYAIDEGRQQQVVYPKETDPELFQWHEKF